MTLPLYQSLQGDNAPKTPTNDDCHLGLWYTRFFNHYNAQWTLKDTAKQEWVSNLANKRCGNATTLEQQALRLLRLVNALEGQIAVCKTTWHFATGLGLPHPVENGLAWHPTLGVPFLAGSAMKGLLRAWVEVWDDSLSDEERLQRRRTWFGMVKGQEGDEHDQAGKLIFFDAIPINPVSLTADIMTPHYGKWYEQGHEIKGHDMATLLQQHHERLPADWHEPVPVPFLAVKQAQLLVAVAPRDAKQLANAALALDSLIAALHWLGAGAKTAAGYGHFVRDESAENDLRQKQQQKEEDKKNAAKNAAKKAQLLAELSSDLQKELHTALFEAPNQSIAEANATKWLDEMEKRKADEAQEIAEMLKKFYTNIEKWKGGSNKQKEKVKRVKKVLGLS
jgi:CRISPR-associated protein Cmr6